MDKRALFDCWKMFQREHDISIDRLVCDPQLRQDFVQSAALVCGCFAEQEILWTLMGMRKDKKYRMSKQSSDT